MENTAHLKYIYITLDSTFSYKKYINYTRMKVATRNNLIKKSFTSKWGTRIKSTALALCYSVAEYACPVWERSAHAQSLYPELNQACREITGCLKASKVEDLYLIAGISAMNIRRNVCASVEKKKHKSNETHSQFGQKSSEKFLPSRNCFLLLLRVIKLVFFIFPRISWLYR